MGEESRTIRLPEGLAQRLLGGTLALLMGLALAGAAIAVSGFAAFGVFEKVVKIVVTEFATMISLYCLLIFLWCVCRPSWVQRTVNKVMKNFVPLAIIMSIGALFLLSVSLALA